MDRPELLRLISGTSTALHHIVNPDGNPLLPPIRSEIFGMQRFAQHGQSLGETHRATVAGPRIGFFFPRLESNIRALRQAHRYIGIQASTDGDTSPAAEWLLDNFHLIEAQFKKIHEGLPRSYFRALPALVDPPLAGLPRIYGVAWAFTAHTDGGFDEDLLVGFLSAYQDSCELNLGEIWALPTTLRVVLIENLRRLAERLATHRAVQALADLCCDELESCTLHALDELLGFLRQRGVEQVFLAQMAHRLKDCGPHALRVANWLRAALPDPAAAWAQRSADEAADNLSIGNAVSSLRSIDDADWPDIVARASTLIRQMLASPLFEAEHPTTRDQTLHGIERMARRLGLSERSVATALLQLMQSAHDAGDPSARGARGVASHWLTGAGQPALKRALGRPTGRVPAWRTLRSHVALPAYLASLLAGTLGLLAWLLMQHGSPFGAPTWVVLLGLAAMALPASEAVIAVINRLVCESVRPSPLPRLALAQGIPPEHQVMVVIPGMLTDTASIDALAHRLHLHHLANPEKHAQFALLTDWADADTAQAIGDEALLARATEQIAALNTRHADTPGSADTGIPRFILLHRPRSFSTSEGRWIGWERKRGKLEQLIALLAGPETSASSGFMDLGVLSRAAPGTRHVLTLDSDTQLPPGRLRDLVGIAAHPDNRPRLDVAARTVVSGYGILQPRILTPLPAPQDATLYHWLFAGQCGIDPYSAASSDLYQDLFAEGTFTGKGLLDVQALHAVLSGRLPCETVLSHDLLEGSLVRCAAVSEITLIEDAPFHADVAASRVHRWTRGDWQLLPFLCSRPGGPGHYQLRAINRWKMVDNLRRSLVAPLSLTMLVMSLAGLLITPWAALAVVMAAFSAGPLIGALAGFSSSRDDLAKRHFYRLALIDLVRALAAGFWLQSQLLQQALMASDAVIRTAFRMAISRRHLLQWTTSAAAHAAAATSLSAIARQHWKTAATALLVLGALMACDTPYPAMALALCLLWASAPLWIWAVSRPRADGGTHRVSVQDHDYLHSVARDTWRLFERCVGPQDNHLPPDNLQVVPRSMVAHRTSPTNIGMYLLSTACARQFGWIGTQDLIERLAATLDTLATLPRHQGHFFNWYDTCTKDVLLPAYVSTVDSGNLCGHLLAVSQACRALAMAPNSQASSQRAIDASMRRMAPLLAQLPALLPAWGADTALARLLSMQDPLAHCQRHAIHFKDLLRKAAGNMASLFPALAEDATPGHPTAIDELCWCLSDHLAMLESAWLDAQALSPARAALSSERLRSLADTCEQLAWQADFRFLYHPRRHLFHLGFRVAEQQLDSGFYDLLASEARLTSVLAIAKGDVPASHWSSLGRPFHASGIHVGLQSWSGSMFEYLMPGLVLDEPPGSLLAQACQAALREQIAFGRAHGIPWGISESAYADHDDTLAYQYAPRGVPQLALRRTPTDDLVIAPYATALAAQISPHRARLNFEALEALSARGRYGFIEALDFSPLRQTGSAGFTPVATFMAHHQAMSIVALANVLLQGIAQRWCMGNAAIEAVGSLLHAPAPREVAPASTRPELPAPSAQPRTVGLLREVLPGSSAIEPTHLLSNGRYSVRLRANGAGESRWRQINLTRSRDDALRDLHGSFFYVRWDRSPALASLTQHPAPDPSAHYQSTYHADRVCFDTTWAELHASTTVWVSPEDDVELRQVELRNLGDRPLELELISAFDITLTEQRADEAHPVFTSMFVQAQWLAHQQALVFERRPRRAEEAGLQAAHFLTELPSEVLGLRCQTDRQHWLGRNGDASRPLATLADVPTADAASFSGESPLDTGLDPVCALAVRLRIAPRATVRLTFATAASDSAATLRAVIDKYRQHSHVQRASLMSATLSGIRLRALRISPENFVAVQTLTTAIAMSLTRAQAPLPGQDDAPAGVCDRRLLWRFGISGDRPIITVTAGSMVALGLLRSLAQALRLWSWGGLGCDLVIIDEEPVSYLRTLHQEMGALREHHATDLGTGEAGHASLHILGISDLSADERSTLRELSRLWLQADGRPLAQHVQDWAALHEQALQERLDTSTSAVGRLPASPAAASAPKGAFDESSGEFHFGVSARLRPVRPWINVLANPGFGAQITEAGGGHTWATNSRLNQLTAWSNDPVADPPAEWFLLQDTRTMKAWSVAPSAWGDGDTTYRVSHGQGHTTIGHRRGELEVTASWCVDAHSAVKQVRLQLRNHGPRPQQLRVIGLLEWMMGAQRADRNTTRTALHRQRLPALRASDGQLDGLRQQKLTALMCTQRDHSAGFGGGTAFLGLAASPEADDDWTCDRREFFDARGQLVLPDHLGKKQGQGLDPCAALSTRLSLAPGTSAEVVFLIGHAPQEDAAKHLAATAAATDAAQRLAQVGQTWDQWLNATTVRTPDPQFDVMVNRWLLYQTISCRLWSKAGFYQAGGATGFRDQLQDAMALGWAAPQMLRQQIIDCASRQFEEGDVQHWWHAPQGAGVRTHFSDDLLWLPHACVHYLRATADHALLDEHTPFLEGGTVPPGAEDLYETPRISAHTASIYEHAARTLDRSLAVGVHGLPLMGSGDWNDGMNCVGIEGRGESVWLGWFLCRLVADFAPVASARGDTVRAQRWEQAARGWQAALHGPAWDGQWFRRAFFDDGQALGSGANPEARIDLIAQAWSVLSGVAPPAMQHQAMAAVHHHLADQEAGLLKLLDPPLVNARPSAGYIQAYPPGVRENGGQYAHAGVWALMAQAELSRQARGTRAGDLAWRYFTWLSPAHRARHPAQGAVYGIEPYVMAGDVYTQPPYVGRGGWSWYTGSAAWMHRAAIESIFGLQLQAHTLRLLPCLPSHWTQAELTLRRDGRSMRFIIIRASHEQALRETAEWQARPLLCGQTLDWSTLTHDTCFVVPLMDGAAP
ncbi:GH36-type glycosyl hydrolase domain-containing protein [Aquabacterium soli]|nr:glucoamylase family protein [Aquabacterium soli]